MILISPDVYYDLTRTQDESLKNRLLSQLDQSMLDIIKENIPETVKITKYNQLLQKYLQISSTAPEISIHSEISKNDDIEPSTSLLEHFPNGQQTKVVKILRFLAKHPDKINLMANGDVFLAGEQLENANGVDLVYHLIKSNPPKSFPPGWLPFLDCLRNLNFPASHIVNTKLRHQYEQQTAADKDEWHTLSAVVSKGDDSSAGILSEVSALKTTDENHHSEALQWLHW